MKYFFKFWCVFVGYLTVVQMLAGQSPSFKTYINPVIPGDHSDCTLTKVGNHYYTTGSSFNPTPVIYHSTDLVHWEAIAQPVSAAWSNYDDVVAGGCWGGQIVFYNNKYWDFFGRAFVMYFVTSDKPEGPWSAPTRMNTPSSVPGLGADNSIFIDSDSTWYLLVKNGQANNWIVQLGKDGQPAGNIYDLTWLNPSPSYPYSWAEGPVMWKYKGYYYYSFAHDVSGGQKVMRSSLLTSDKNSWTVLGDFFNESDPGKPQAIFSGPNHNSAAVVIDDSTSWVLHPVWARANNNEWYGQGRQGLLNQVRYDANGKPTADYPINTYKDAPKLPSSGIPWMVPKSDFFTGTKLNPEWSFLGYTPLSSYSLSERAGWLRLKPRANTATSNNTVIKTDAEHNYSLITHLDFNPVLSTDEAGLRIINGLQNLFAKIYTSIDNIGHKVICFSFNTTVYKADNNIGNDLWLKIVRVNHVLSGFYSANGFTWTQLGNDINVSTLDGSQANYNGWCGNRQGLYVQGAAADFDLYIYRDAYTPILAGTPANQYGTIQTGTNSLDSIHNNDWALYAGVEFGNNEYAKAADSIQITASALVGGNVEVWLDSIDTGTKIGTCAINSTGSWITFKTFTAKIIQTTGRHDVYLKFTSSSSSRLFQLKWIQFISKNALLYASSSTTSDSTINIKLTQKIVSPQVPSGLKITLNSSENDSIRSLVLNPSDSSELMLTMVKKLVFTDKITVSYIPGSIKTPDGLELLSFSNNIVTNFLPDSSFHIYLCFGQSNMEGNATIQQQDKTVDSRFKVMAATDCSNLGRTKGSWYTAIPPLCRCYTGLTPADYFGRTLVSRLPSNIKVGIVMVAVAGCKIELFDKNNYQSYLATTPDWLKSIANEYGGNPYQRLVDLAKQAQKSGIIKGILLHQGESNTGDNQWTSKVKGVYNNLIKDLNLNPNLVPLLAGEVVNADQGGICASMNSIIAKLPDTIPNAHVVSSKGCTDTTDNLHFNAAGYRELGKRYGQQMLKYVYNICDSTTTESWYQVSGGTLKKSNNIIIGTGKRLTLSPRPVDLGTWSWNGAGTIGTSREQIINTTTEGTYKAIATYTNACGTVSRLPIQIVVCDSTVIQSWYQINGSGAMHSSTINVLRGANLVLSPYPADGNGTWSWSGAGTSGSLREQTINTASVGNYNAMVSYTNNCGALSRLTIKVSVCDSTDIESWYQVDGGASVKSDSIKVKQDATLKLLPEPSSGGTWNWSGAGTSGTVREQIVNTSSPGSYLAAVIYTNTCGIVSHENIKIIVFSTVGIDENKVNGDNIDVYPNPASSGNFTLRGIEKIHQVDVLNLVGDKIAEYNIVNQTALDIHLDLKPGVFVVKLSDGQQVLYKKVVVK